MVQQKPDNPQGTTRPRLSQCNCRQPFQEKPNTTHRMVSGTPDFKEDFSTLGTSSDRSICHKSEYKTPNLCVPHPGPTGLGSGRSKHILEKHDRLRLSPHSTTTKSGPKVTVPGMQAHPDSPGLANEIVVLGSGGTVSRPPKTTPTNSLITQTTIGVPSSKTKVFLQKWQTELLHLKDSLLEPSTPQNGQFSNIGASNNRWTSGLPLYNTSVISCASSLTRKTDALPPLRDIGLQSLTPWEMPH